MPVDVFLSPSTTGVHQARTGVQTSAGAADAGKLVALDAAGTIAVSMLPSGLGPEVAAIQATEALAAGAWVNVYNASGQFRARNADGSGYGKQVHGFVLAACASGATAQVYTKGRNTSVTGQTPGDVWLSATPGVGGATPLAASGQCRQRIGVAVSATAVDFEPHAPIDLYAAVV